MIQKEIELGPIHPWLPGMMKLKLGLEGDRVLKVEPEFGFTKRNIIEHVVSKPFEEAQRYFSRIDPEAALISDRIFSELVEQAAQLKLSARSAWIRDIATEMTELSQALKYLSRMSEHLGIQPLTHLIRKHREELLDLTERLTGSRYGYFYVIPGGTRFDITDGFLERCEAWTKNFLNDYDRMNSFFNWTRGFQNRLNTLGFISDEKQDALSSSVGSRLNHVMEAAKELAQSMNESSTQISTGAFLQKIPDTFETLKATTSLHTFRGDWTASVEFSKNKVIKKIELETPSDRLKKTIPHLLEGESFDDLPLLLFSIDLSVTEVDR